MSDTDKDKEYKFDINQYQIVSKINEGQYGRVYKVKEKTTGTLYAAKILKNEIDDQTAREELKNLIREVTNMSKSKHPSIVQFIGFSPIDYENKLCPVIVTEYLPISLNQLFDAEKRGLSTLNSTDKLIILYGIANGMKYLHENEIIHRDLKLDNILLDENKKPKVVDFGFSKCLEKSKIDISDSADGYKGTPLYSSPEIMIEHEYTKSGDVYAFGMIAYVIMSNEIPFKDCTFEKLQLKIANGIRPDLNLIMNEEYKSLIERCWSQEKSDRPTFKEIVEELENTPGFITEDMDEDEFISYVDSCKDCEISFDESRPIISIDDYGELITQKKNEKAIEHFIIAKNFFFGKDVPVNKRKSAENCRIAAELGYLDAVFNYALILYKGEGVPMNKEKALHYIGIVYQKDKDLKANSFFEDDMKSNKWLNKFKLKKYLAEKKECYQKILGFVDDNIDYNELTDFLKNANLNDNKDELKLFFDLIVSIANNHQRHPNFFNNINKIILYFKDQIEKTFSNFEIFDIFKNNKLILLFLFDNKIISVDKKVYIELIDKNELNGPRYCEFFFPEIKQFEEKEKLNFIDINEIENKVNKIINFEEKRHLGENDSYLCWLIRNDSIEEFKIYTIQENIELTSKIRPSIFETNSHLNKNNPNLLEYAAFYGSNKIIHYLQTKNIELTQPFWIYLIHSRNFKIESKDLNYEAIFSEAIKCHHNDIVDMIESNFLKSNIKETKLLNCIRYHNYLYFSYEISKVFGLFDFSQYCYKKIVDFLIKMKEGDIKKILIDKVLNQIF